MLKFWDILQEIIVDTSLVFFILSNKIYMKMFMKFCREIFFPLSDTRNLLI